MGRSAAGGILRPLLALARAVDAVTTRIGRWTSWLILATVLISAGNAVVRKTLHTSSNAALEIQWYLFAAVFMLLAGYVFLRNAHVRIDFVSARLAPRTRNWIDVIGIVLFALPLCGLLIAQSVPVVLEAWRNGETSPNAGGLIRWPVYALLPMGMALLFVQCLSELVKRLAFLRGLIPDPLADRRTDPDGAAEAGH
jgi:TRAP-type mannitol/chloroaromatic compound transport system permease small subunit